MLTTEIKSSLKQAVADLKIAEYELNRPNEDVVVLSVCLTARQSMGALMRLFLLSRSIDHNEGKSLANLLNQCKTVDKQFESINLNKIFCNDLSASECENEYCLSTENVSNCIAVAAQLKSLVLNKLKLAESEIE